MKKLIFIFVYLVSIPSYAAKCRYFVPTSRDGQISEMSYSIDDLKIELTSGHRTLIFQLPEDLVTASEKPVVLTEAGYQKNLFIGNGVSTKCQNMADIKEVHCKMTYAPFYLDITVEQLQGFLRQKYANSPELLKEKFSLGTNFILDPEGELIISNTTL